MFYRPENGHGLAHNPFNALIAPRPIGWISTRGEDGRDNLAPYSFFNAVAYEPPQVMFASTGGKPDRRIGKDSLDNIRASGVFCVNIVTLDLLEAMNVSSEGFAREIDEFEAAGLDKAACETIDCARVGTASAALECRLEQIVTLEGASNHVAFGIVTGVHIAQDCLKEGRFDASARGLVARMGYRDYALVREVFPLARPGET